MILLRWLRWYDPARRAKVEEELAAGEVELVQMAVRLAALEAEVYPYGKRIGETERDRQP